MANPITGSCCCGNVSYSVKKTQPLWYCHCRECRKMTGHFMAAAQAQLDDIQISGDPKWYYVSDCSRYGFCPDCGSQIFWRNDKNDFMSITGGSMDDASGLAVAGHIFSGEKGGYYNIPEAEINFIKWSDSIEHG